MIFNFQLSTLNLFKRYGLALVIVALLVAALGVTYYRWKSEIRRAAQAELLNQQEAGEIASLRAGAVASEAQGVAREARLAELAEQVQKAEVRSQKLAAEFAAAVEREKKARAEIAALTPTEVKQKLEEKIGPSGHGPSEDQPMNRSTDEPILLSTAQSRSVLQIIADRDACVQLSTLNSQLLQNCEDRNSMFEVQRSELTSQVRDLKQALDLEKRAFDQRDDLAKKQVKTARGSWLRRSWEKIDGPVLFVAGAAVAVLATR